MPNHYFITGLPRSRTSWMANLFTHGSSFCHHDATSQVSSISDLPGLMGGDASMGAKHVGNSDSGIAWVFGQKWKKLFPQAKYIVVRRKPEDVVRSLVDFIARSPYAGSGGAPNRARVHEAIGTLHAKLDEMIKELPSWMVHTIKFEDLNKIEEVEKAWRWLLPDEVGWCPYRYASLDNLRIEPFASKIAVNSKQFHALVENAIEPVKEIPTCQH